MAVNLVELEMEMEMERDRERSVADEMEMRGRTTRSSERWGISEI